MVKRVRRDAFAAMAAGKGEIKVVRVRSKQILDEKKKEIEFDSEQFLTEPAFVKIGVGATRSIGDYESLRVDVAVTVPCYKERIDQTAAALGAKVALIFEKELDEWGVGLHDQDED